MGYLYPVEAHNHPLAPAIGVGDEFGTPIENYGNIIELDDAGYCY